MMRYPAPIMSYCVLIALCAVVWADPAFAQGEGIDNAIANMHQTLDTVGTTIGQRARQLLLLLFGIDIVLRFGRWAITDARIDEVFGAFIFQFLFVLIVYALTLLVPQSVAWLTSVATQLASEAGGLNTAPSASAMIVDGLKRAVGWLGEISPLRPGTWFYLLAAFISIIVLAMTIAILVVTYAEIYLVALAGMIVMGFAGLQETRSLASGYIRMLIGKGLKLMGLLIIFSTMGQIATTSAVGQGTGFENAMVVILLQIISAVLVLVLPGAIEGLMSAPGGSSAAIVAGGAAGRLTQAGLAKVMAGVAAVAKVATAATAGAAAGAGKGLSGAAGATAASKAASALKGAGSGAMDWAGTAQRGETAQRIKDGVEAILKKK